MHLCRDLLFAFDTLTTNKNHENIEELHFHLLFSSRTNASIFVKMADALQYALTLAFRTRHLLSSPSSWEFGSDRIHFVKWCELDGFVFKFVYFSNVFLLLAISKIFKFPLQEQVWNYFSHKLLCKRMVTATIYRLMWNIKFSPFFFLEATNLYRWKRNRQSYFSWYGSR